MIVVDAHEDIAYNALVHRRDYRQSALLHRRNESNLPPAPGRGGAMIGLPEALLGRVAIIFATLFVEPYRRNATMAFGPTYTEPQEAYEMASQQLDYYERISDEHDKLNIIRDMETLDRVLASWGEGTEIADHQMGLVILMENADPILEPKQFEEWYERGVRIVGPAWKASRYSGGTHEPGPLTDLGRELLEIMADFGVILDLSHMAEAAFLEAVNRYEGTIIASHSNPRKFRNTDRHLSDEMIRRLAERDGVMGIVMQGSFLADDYDPRQRLPFSIVPDAIDYVCQLTGSARHVGLGSDFDGGFGMERTPQGLDTVTDLLKIATALRERGYSEADVQAIMNGNMLRQLRQALIED